MLRSFTKFKLIILATIINTSCLKNNSIIKDASYMLSLDYSYFIKMKEKFVNIFSFLDGNYWNTNK